MIREQIEAVAKANGGQAEITEDLLEEVLYLVEYPTALCGNFEEKYLQLPPEAVITPMRDHQRYFPVKTADGKLLPLFITAILSKADLVTGMVTEFTELQGIMGREYAKLDGECEKVAIAIDEHYKPRFAGDSQPQTTAGRIVSLADKIARSASARSRRARRILLHCAARHSASST